MILRSIIAIVALSILSPALAVEKIGAPEYVSERAAYAYEISGGNKMFVGTLDAENSLWTEDRRSNTGYYRKGVKRYDWGICQVSEYYHPTIVNDLRFWTDWKWQVRKCWDLYKG